MPGAAVSGPTDSPFTVSSMRVASSGAFERRSAESIARAIELEIIGADLAVGA